MNILDILHKIVTERSLVFGAGNHEPEFLGCLTYCLLRLNSNKNIEAAGAEAGSCDDDSEAETELDLERSEDVTKHQSHNLVANASARVWSLMYAAKKPALEEVFKCSFGASNNVTPTLASIQPNLMEPARSVNILKLSKILKLLRPIC